MAVLIVAATTAGVLFNVTDVLQSRADITGEAVTSEVDSPLTVVAVTGRVNQTADPSTLTDVRVIVSTSQAPVSVDLRQATALVETPGAIDDLEYSADTPTAGETFSVEALSDPDGSAPVVTETTDQFAVVIETPPLSVHDRFAVRLQLESGATKRIEIRVPERIRTESAVSLR
ncbi:flagellin [Halodesulfurarchaeum formicicum]|uniref:Flagellin n=1 Tax=Halodesulfurarchaeum formicicum TaxID=1873524 RepID=A0A1D8S5C4_9EURY|nr:flagellin [Halodesulfurarchaeum formicicum]